MIGCTWGPGDRVLEIGTGWGAFAVHGAATRGCHVTTITISREQHDYVVAQDRPARLSDRVTVLMKDYRDLHRYGLPGNPSGRADRIRAVRGQSGICDHPIRLCAVPV